MAALATGPEAVASAINVDLRAEKLHGKWRVRRNPAAGSMQARLEAKGLPGSVKIQSANVPRVELTPGTKRMLLELVVRLDQRMAETGCPLKAALEAVLNTSNKRETRLDWDAAITAFQDDKLNRGTAVKRQTFHRWYAGLLQDALKQVKSASPPADGQALIESITSRWKPGSRSREIGVRNMSQFLTFVVERRGFPGIWLPPKRLDHLIGTPIHGQEVNQKADPIEDCEILELISEVEKDSPRHADALRLIAELGLRPIEVLHVKLWTEEATGEERWWCSYVKKGGKGSTRPPWCHALPLEDTHGNEVRWNLMERWRAGEIQLPNLDGTNGPADAIRSWLSKKPYWKQLLAQVQSRGKRATLYSLRHSYSLRGHHMGLTAAVMAHAMGHSEQTHAAHYPWASDTGTAKAVALAVERKFKRE